MRESKGLARKRGLFHFWGILRIPGDTYPITATNPQAFSSTCNFRRED